jgi:hypothetical protein
VLLKQLGQPYRPGVQIDDDGAGQPYSHQAINRPEGWPGQNVTPRTDNDSQK